MIIMNQQIKPYRWLILAFSANLLCASFLVYVVTLGGFDFLENEGVGLGFHIRGAVDPEHVVIVSIDDSSIIEYGPWPWSRKVMANLIDQISRHNPSAIAMNMVFSEKSIPSDDQLFKDAIVKSGHVVVARPFKELSHNLSSSKPEFLATSEVMFGNLDLVRDNEDRVVGINVVSSKTSQTLRSQPFALVTANIVDNTIMDVVGKKQLVERINWVGPEKTVLHISALDLLKDTHLPDLTGKVVLVGCNALGLAAFEETYFGMLSSTEVQANIVESLLQRNVLVSSFAASVLVLTIVGLIIYLLLIQDKMIWSMAVVLLYLVLVYLFFVFGAFLLPITPVVFMFGLNILFCKLLDEHPKLNES